MRRPLSVLLLVCSNLISPLAASASNARWHEVSEGAWHVPSKTIADMDSRLQQAADNAVATSVTKEQRLVLNDTIQYQGVFDQKAKRKLVQIYGMCMTDKTLAQLRDFWAVVHDGGNCYYWATYDPALGKFIDFRYNSAA